MPTKKRRSESDINWTLALATFAMIAPCMLILCGLIFAYLTTQYDDGTGTIISLILLVLGSVLFSYLLYVQWSCQKQLHAIQMKKMKKKK